jgi:hypothetical protein
MKLELIPKQTQKPIFGQIFFVFVSAVLLIGVILTFVILSQFITGARDTLAELDRVLKEDTRPLEEQLSESLRYEKSKIEVLEFVLKERRTMFPFLRLLEETTHPEVFFHGFSGDARTGVFALSGEAKDFFVLEQQRLVWESRDEFTTDLQSIQRSGEGAGEFGVEFTLEPELLRLTP